jgi:Domain of unknown function (DUF4296)
MMRKKLAIFCLLFLIIGCNDSVIKKPKNLIEKDKMIDVLYDLSLLESIKAQNISGGISNNSVTDYIYKKYKIDSIQLVESNKYYASDIEEYKKMFEIVKERLNNETLKIEGKSNQNGQSGSPSTSRQPISDTPQVQ